MMLRKWQAEASESYRVKNSRDFLVSATPGAGKTSFALHIINKLLSVKAVEQVIIVAPTDHLRTQWAENSLDSDLFLDPSLGNRTPHVGDDYHGYVTTYAQVASNPLIHARRVASKSTLVVFDEIHHAGDGLTWGDALYTAFSRASRRLSLTGTPFRTSINSKIPFVVYDNQDDGSKISKPDYVYGYADALRDGVVRPVTFVAYSGQARWIDSAGEVYESTLNEANDREVSDVLRTSFDPKGEWIKKVFIEADARLQDIRKSFPDAGGLILASDQDSAKEYARVLRKITGNPVTVVTSDDNKASEKISIFSKSTDPWIVAVRMVSEGVDIPRLFVEVWATNYRTPLFFAQAVGRVVRLRQRGEISMVFLPAVKPLLSLAASMETERNHVILQKTSDEDEAEEDYVDSEDAERDKNVKTSLHSSASFDHVLFNGKALTGDEGEAMEELSGAMGLPGLLSPQQMAALLRSREGSTPTKTAEKTVNVHAKILETRKGINKIVSRVSLKRGVSHAYLHKRTQVAIPGPPSSRASLEVLSQRLEWLQNNFL